MNKIPDKYRDLLYRPIVVSLATLMSDGTPQVQPVWCSFDGTHILVNTEKDRQKYRNMSRRRAVTILAIDPDNDTRWLEVRGTVVGETEEGANEHIDELARLYMGVDRYPFHREGDVRVIFKIAPQRVATMESSMPDFAGRPDPLCSVVEAFAALDPSYSSDRKVNSRYWVWKLKLGNRGHCEIGGP